MDWRRQVVVGVAAGAFDNALGQARMALDFGCRGILLAPPFYFKDVPDEGLFRWFAMLVERLGGAARDIILYHLPSVTAVPLSIELIGRLKAAFPGVIVGVKDSSGDRAYGQSLLAAHGDLTILIGDERLLAGAVRQGAEGSICGMANLCPELLLPLADEGRDDPVVDCLVEEVIKYPVIPAVKALVAHRTGDPAWLRVGPPLMPLAAAEAQRLATAFDGILAAKAA
jgi:4-hydroxy-tetrahydrodipicolinate synthase